MKGIPVKGGDCSFMVDEYLGEDRGERRSRSPCKEDIDVLLLRVGLLRGSLLFEEVELLRSRVRDEAPALEDETDRCELIGRVVDAACAGDGGKGVAEAIPIDRRRSDSARAELSELGGGSKGTGRIVDVCVLLEADERSSMAR